MNLKWTTCRIYPRSCCRDKATTVGWQYYKDVKRKVGQSLRIRNLPLHFIEAIPDGHTLDDVRIVERTKDSVTLQLWSHEFDVRPIAGGYAQRYTVTVVHSAPDPHWIVERF